MDKAQLDPIAQILVPAYLNTASYSRQFRDDYGSPPTLFSKIHHMRAVVQAMVSRSSRFKLEPDYSEYGRVHILDETEARHYLLRSGGAVAIEEALQQSPLFDSNKYLRSDVILLVQTFHPDGMDLGVAGTRQRAGKKRLEASGKVTFVGTWPFFSDGVPPFDQGAGDPFAELGDIPSEETGEADKE